VINSRFSLLQAYFVGIKMLLEYISFYMVWYAIVMAVGFLLSIGLGVYLDLLDYKALATDWSWVGSIISQWFSEIKLSYSAIPKDATVYGLLNHLLPNNILNHSIESMSWAEYFNIIVLPKKIVLLIALAVASWLSMSVSIGFIKTALAFQSNKVASFHDMYRYFYLVPPYVATKIIMMLACIVPIALLLVTHFYLGMFTYVMIVVSGAIIVFLYQRLRFAKYFVIDKNQNPIAACVASWHVTKGCVFHLLIFSICAVAVMTHHFSGLLMYFFVTLDKQTEVSVYRQLMGYK